MGLDVLSVRCHRHNIAHSRTQPCPRCHEEARKRIESAAAAESTDRLVLRNEVPGSEPDITLFAPALLRAQMRWGGSVDEACWLVLARALAEIEARDAAEAAELVRFPLAATWIAPSATTELQVQPWEPAALCHFDLQADEKGLECLQVERVSCGTRIVAVGGTAAQLHRCALPRHTMHPSVGAVLILRNVADRQITVRGVCVGRRNPRRNPIDLLVARLQSRGVDAAYQAVVDADDDDDEYPLLRGARVERAPQAVVDADDDDDEYDYLEED